MQENSSSQKSPCRICLQASPNSTIDGCDHRFCLPCIKRWAKRCNTCPLCRAEFVQIRRGRKLYEVDPPSRPPRRLIIQSQNAQYLQGLERFEQAARLRLLERMSSEPITPPFVLFFAPAINAWTGQARLMPMIAQSFAFPYFFNSS